MRFKKIARLAMFALLCLTVQWSRTSAVAGVLASLDTGVSVTLETEPSAVGDGMEDTEPPIVVKATGSDRFNQITVAFSEPIHPMTSTFRSNYQVSGEVTVQSVEEVDPMTLRLMTSRMEPDTLYTLKVNNVFDLAGNKITDPGNEITFRSFAFVEGYAKSEVWTGIETGTVADLISDPRFPNSPDTIEYALKLEWGAKDLEGVGVRVSAFLTPLESDSYVFYMASSHEALLYLSTDETPENRAVIASEHVSHLARSWSSSNTRLGCPDACENRSAPIRLTAGTRYLLELVFTDGVGVGYSGVTWTKEGQPAPRNGTRPLSGNQIGTFADPSLSIKGDGGSVGGDAAITGVSIQSGNIVIDFSSGTLESADEIVGPWTSVPGVSSPAKIPVEGDQKFYRVR